MSNDLASTTPANLPSAVPVPVSLPSQDRVAAIMDKVPRLRAIAGDLFPGEVSVEVEADPEIEGRRYVMFSVETKDDYKEVINRRRAWFRLTGDLLGNDADLVHLFVIYR